MYHMMLVMMLVIIICTYCTSTYRLLVKCLNYVPTTNNVVFVARIDYILLDSGSRVACQSSLFSSEAMICNSRRLVFTSAVCCCVAYIYM